MLLMRSARGGTSTIESWDESTKGAWKARLSKDEGTGLLTPIMQGIERGRQWPSVLVALKAAAMRYRRLAAKTSTEGLKFRRAQMKEKPRGPQGLTRTSRDHPGSSE